jgi:hypothetical protein
MSDGPGERALRSGSDVTQSPDAIRRQISDRSQVLASLYAALQVAGDAGHDPTRPGPRVAEESLPEQIRRVTREVGQLGAQLRRSLAAGGADVPPAPTPAQREQLELDRRLLDLADRQVEAVRRWNVNPTDDRRDAFEDEMRRLHEEFSRTLQRLNALRGAGHEPPSGGGVAP